MFLSLRARVIAAAQDGVPPGDVLRWVQPEFYLPVLRRAVAAYSSQVATDGLNFVDASRRKSTAPRPAPRWKQSARPPQGTFPQASGRAAGVSEEIAAAMDCVGEARRPAAFRRNGMTFRFQR